MRRCLLVIVAEMYFALASVGVSAAAVPDTTPGLLSTQRLSQEALEVMRQPTSDADRVRLAAQARTLRSHLDAFIVLQLEALPSIPSSQLQAEIGRILCTPEGTRPCVGSDDPTKVFAADWGWNTQRRQVVVANQISTGFMGQDGSLVKIQSYMWDKESQKARKTSEDGAEFNGMYMHFELPRRTHRATSIGYLRPESRLVGVGVPVHARPHYSLWESTK